MQASPLCHNCMPATCQGLKVTAVWLWLPETWGRLGPPPCDTAQNWWCCGRCAFRELTKVFKLCNQVLCTGHCSNSKWVWVQSLSSPAPSHCRV